MVQPPMEASKAVRKLCWFEREENKPLNENKLWQQIWLNEKPLIFNHFLIKQKVIIKAYSFFN
jgi:hypothetical protein